MDEYESGNDVEEIQKNSSKRPWLSTSSRSISIPDYMNPTVNLIRLPNDQQPKKKKSFSKSRGSENNFEVNTLDDGNELPQHEFISKYVPYQKGPNKGTSRWVSTLIIEPYVFSRIKATDDKQVWSCNSCRRSKSYTYAYSKVENVGEGGKPYHQLMSVNHDHVCEPSLSDCLHTVFFDKIQIQIAQDPTIPLQQVHETVKNEMLATLDQEKHEVFLSNDSSSFKKMVKDSLYKLQGMLHKRSYPCHQCQFIGTSQRNLKAHNWKEHMQTSLNPNVESLDNQIKREESMHNVEDIVKYEIDANESKAETNVELPNHQFLYKYVPYQRGPKKGTSRWVATLIIEPYIFSRIKVNGDKQVWACNSCSNLSFYVYAHSKVENYLTNGQPQHLLVSVGSKHVCKPSPSACLHTKFLYQVQNQILQDPTMKSRDAFETAKDHFLQTLNKEQEEIFHNDKANTFDSMNGSLSKFKGSLNPVTIDHKHSCDVCDFKAQNMIELKKHKLSEHPGAKPHQCSTCGKFFATKKMLVRHEDRGHNCKQIQFHKKKISI